MASIIKAGDVIILRGGEKLTVTGLKSMTNGAYYLYEAECLGERRLLRWYRGAYISALEDRGIALEVYNYILRDIEMGKAGLCLDWPIALTEYPSELGSFGYVTMPYSEKNMSLTDAGIERVGSNSLGARLDSAVLLIDFVKSREAVGWYYKSLRPSALLYDGERESVTAIDYEERLGSVTGVGHGNMKYTAPEVVLGAEPCELSDRLVISEYIFSLIFSCHPFLGELSRERDELSNFVRDAVFIFDREDRRNPPGEDSRRAAKMWEGAPDYVKELFLRCFVRQALSCPDARPTLDEVRETLLRVRGSLSRQE